MPSGAAAGAAPGGHVSCTSMPFLSRGAKACQPPLALPAVPVPQDCLLRAKQLGYQVVATHLRADAVDISQVDWTRPTAFVMGNEEKGELAGWLREGAAAYAAWMAARHAPCQCNVAAIRQDDRPRATLLWNWRMPALQGPCSPSDWKAGICANALPGVSPEALELADACAVVPMAGFVESFNISVAAALIMYEARRSREQKLG